MRRFLRWWLLTSCFVLLLLVSEARRRRKKKTSSNGFVRGEDSDYVNPGKTGISPFRRIQSGQNNRNLVSAASHPITSSVTLRTVSLTTIPYNTTLLPQYRDSSRKLPPQLEDGLLPTTVSVDVILSRELQTSSNTTKPKDDGNVNTYALPEINDTYTSNGIDQKANRYQCLTTEGKMPKDRFCGYPLFYRPSDCADIFCDGLPMKRCENTNGMVAFVALTILLGLVIVAGNAILPCLVARRKEMRNNHYYIKVSLSFADMLSGLILIATVFPNVMKFRNTSERNFVESTAKSNDNITSIVAGALLALSIEASLLHLLFLSIERYLTIRWAVKRDSLRRRTVALILFVVWGFSIAVSILPVMAPSEYGYKMLPILFLSFPTPAPDGNDSTTRQLIIYVCLAMLLPYTATVVVCFLTWLTVRLGRMNNREFRSEISESPRQPAGLFHRFRMFIRGVSRPSTDMTVFKTLLIMIAAFSITLLPLMVVGLQFARGDLNCDNYALPYTLSFYTSISNSFVNVVIYTIRDGKFKEAIYSKMFCSQNVPKANRYTVNDLQTSTVL